MTLELKQILEAVLFSAERALTTKEIRGILSEAVDEDTPGMTEPFRKVREAQIASTLEELKVDYDTQQRAFHLVEVAGGWRLVSRPDYAPWLKRLLDEARPHRLSQPALETLSIIALRQPISRADIAAIRGVEVDGVIKTLLERDLITITGKSDAPGRPMVYGTTQKFLEHFGLPSLDDMPKAAELRLQAAALKVAEEKAAPAAGEEGVTSPVPGEGETGAAPQETADATPAEEDDVDDEDEDEDDEEDEEDDDDEEDEKA